MHDVHFGQKYLLLVSTSTEVFISCHLLVLIYTSFSTGEELICYNLKTSNILLTESLRAKVCCSGLAGSDHVVPQGGTVGYTDPEYFRTSELTAKSDIYSFGIVLLEILSSHGLEDWNLLMKNQKNTVVQWVSSSPHSISFPKSNWC